ncbi:hypothetical protein BCR43DRAFT_492736 [Syncephalastrum racemosum]|uniref:Mate-domain-containing protein n=1 Tax=Syncephalastrum racemosum TaxID=13706 RepID=A0A1X2H9E0_SYNRA|nr:hypothetical protein BCR43DRAFT_492736 [Syncephalastrum racemosum]
MKCESSPLLEKKNVLPQTGCLSYTLLISATLACQGLQSVAGIVALGRLGYDDTLAASAMAQLYATMTLTLMQGAAFTLFAHDAPRLPRVLALQARFCLAVLVLWWFAKPVLVAFGQEADLAEGAGAFLRYKLFGLPAYCICLSVERYLQLHGHARTPARVALMTSLLHCVLVGALVFKPFNVGWAGVPLAESATFWLTAALLVCHIEFPLRVPFEDFWLAWPALLHRALPGALLFATAFWHRHVLTLTVAASDPSLYEAQAVLQPILVAARCIGTGLTLATAWQSKSAKAVAVGCWTALGLGTMLALVAWIGCDAWASLFGELDLVKEVARVMPLVATYLLADLVLAVFLGAMLSMGKPAVALAIQGVAFYGISWPVAYAAPPTLDALWLATALGPVSAVAVFTIYLFKAHWTHEDYAVCDM